MGYDPTKHAVASCFYAELTEATPLTPTGEAMDFAWYDFDDLPWDSLWPGSDLMIKELREHLGPHHTALTYEVLAARQVSHNELMWQTPALAMTAMAFLFTISLGNNDWGSRAVASFLGFLVALVSLQLMAKHSHHQRRDADLLAEIENRQEMMRVNQAPSTETRGLLQRLRQWRPKPVSTWPNAARTWFVQQRSRYWWMATLAGFGLTSATVGVRAVLAGWGGA
jgi:hypothetical protein